VPVVYSLHDPRGLTSSRDPLPTNTTYPTYEELEAKPKRRDLGTLSLNNTPLARNTQVEKGKMETAEAKGGSTRQSRRERAKTTKALENDSYESDTEDTVHMAAVASSAPRSKRTGKKLRPKD